MTKKQKEEQRAAEIRKQALLASGVQIEGLQQSSGPAKRPIYGNRKKNIPKAGSATPTSQPQTPAPPPFKELEPEPEPTPELKVEAPKENQKVNDVKSDWDVSSDEDEKAAAADVKDSWDDPSDEEAAKPNPSRPAANGMDVYVFPQGTILIIFIKRMAKRSPSPKRHRQHQLHQRRPHLRQQPAANLRRQNLSMGKSKL